MTERLMLDVSLLLTRDGIDWLEEESAQRVAIVSNAFYRAVGEVSAEALLPFSATGDLDAILYAKEMLPGRLEAIQRFSHTQVRTLPRTHERVRGRLLALPSPEGEILADEFVYLVTQSWLLAKARKVLDELRAAGVRVHEYADERGERFVMEMIKAVIPDKKIPAKLNAETLAKAGVKWVIVGGGTVGLVALNPLVGIAGLVLPPAVKSFDP